jgi:hypothetical protein
MRSVFLVVELYKNDDDVNLKDVIPRPKKWVSKI